MKNPQLELAEKFLEQTGTNIFLTGKAGTGKTTFLHNLRVKSPKRMIVVAPTGVAAINAGGVTMHSFFQLPFGPYVPGMKSDSAQSGGVKGGFNREKIAIIRSLDLLVIDEISMVRADLLDAVNDVLQRYRDRRKPFGGVQLLMIGDLQQLAPVVKDDEWDIIREHYNSPYFFDSKALKQTPYITLELKHIYRQNDTQFIDILNKVRNNDMDKATLTKLNERYIPQFEPEDKEGYITLTSHNDSARKINNTKLDALKTKAFRFSAEVDGTFPEYSYPTDYDLILKEGAQVMFVKNDTSPEKRYYNGKIGVITTLEKDRIEVSVENENEPIGVNITEWTNTKYSIDPDTKEITEKIEGRFVQYPLKTAWAITIHKSQGLTFERAIIDAAASFSHGQVYVALSRCKNFEGLVLKSPLPSSAIINDSTVKQYNRTIEENQPDDIILAAQKKAYFESLLVELFDFNLIKYRTQAIQRVITENLAKIYPTLAERWILFSGGFSSDILNISEKFKLQIKQLIAVSENYENDPLLEERISKGKTYFLSKCEELIIPLLTDSHVDIDNKETKKIVNDTLKRAEEDLFVKMSVLRIQDSGIFSVKNYLEVRATASVEKPKFKTPVSDKKIKSTEESGKEKKKKDSGDIKNPEIFEILRGWRKIEADKLGGAAFMVLHQKPLIDICNTLPESQKELLAIEGIGKKFIEKYGDAVLDIIKDYIDGKEG